MNRTGWTALAVAGVLVIAVVTFELLTRESARPDPAVEGAATSSTPSLQPELPAPGTKADLTGPGSIDDAAAAPGEDSAGEEPGVAGDPASAPPGGTAMDASVEAGGSSEGTDPGDAGDDLDDLDDTGSRLATMEITLYFVRPDGQGLSPEPVAIFATSRLLDRLKQAVAALIRGPAPDSPLAPSLPPETPLRDVFLDGEGTLYIDFGQELVNGLATGSGTEIHAAASLANTLILNFPEVRRVRMLAMGDDIETLGGHLDLTRSLRANRRLIRPWTAPPDEWWSDRLVSRMAESGHTGARGLGLDVDPTSQAPDMN